MIEWLLKEEEKNKVGRPVLAKSDTVKKSFYMLVFCVLIIACLSFSFFCVVTKKSPLYYVSKYSKSKLLANVNNKNGFIVKNHYKDNNYVIKVDVSNKVKSYSGKYRYILYEYKKGTWNECDTNTYDNDKTSYKILIERKKNKNVTYKLRLEVTDGSKIDESFAPMGWEYLSDKKNNIMYTYNIFTVDGYYSPIDNSETKEAEKKENKISILTDEINPRKFIVDNKSMNYDVLVSYTDDDGKIVKLKKIENQNDKTEFDIPVLNRVSDVTFKIWLNDVASSDIKDYKLSNWQLEKSHGKRYFKVTYKLKPFGSYK